jgi:hypothetical protein
LRGGKQAKFNRALPVLAAMLKYAEALGYLRKGSNPCRGTPRFKRKAMERFLSPPEYRRLGLAEPSRRNPSAQVAAIRLLLTPARGRRRSAACNGTGCRRRVCCCPTARPAPRRSGCAARRCRSGIPSAPRRLSLRVSEPKGDAPLKLDVWWSKFRRRCALPDLRIHDLRHSYASIAIRHNMPLATIGKLLGHELPETTAKYAHLADETIADAAARVSGGLASAIGLGA